MCKHKLYYNIRYNKLFQQVFHKEVASKINYINIFQNAKTFSISVVNNYPKYQLMHTFIENLQKGGI